jgi:hypothetical protein
MKKRRRHRRQQKEGKTMKAHRNTFFALLAGAFLLAAGCVTTPPGFVDPGRGAKPMKDGEMQLRASGAGGFSSSGARMAGGNLRGEWQMGDKFALGLDLLGGYGLVPTEVLGGSYTGGTTVFTPAPGQSDMPTALANGQVIMHYNPTNEKLAFRGGAGGGLFFIGDEPGQSVMAPVLNAHGGIVTTLLENEIASPYLGFDLGLSYTLPMSLGLFNTISLGLTRDINDMLALYGGVHLQSSYQAPFAVVPLNGRLFFMPWGNVGVALKF